MEELLICWATLGGTLAHLIARIKIRSFSSKQPACHCYHLDDRRTTSAMRAAQCCPLILFALLLLPAYSKDCLLIFYSPGSCLFQAFMPPFSILSSTMVWSILTVPVAQYIDQGTHTDRVWGLISSGATHATKKKYALETLWGSLDKSIHKMVCYRYTSSCHLNSQPLLQRCSGSWVSRNRPTHCKQEVAI